MCRWFGTYFLKTNNPLITINHEKKISLDVRPTMGGIRRIAGTVPYGDGCGNGTR